MQKSKNLSVFKTIIQNCFLFFSLVFITRLFQDGLVYLSAVICGGVWYWRLRDKSTMFVILFLLCMGFHQNHIPEWKGNTGRVISITQNTATIVQGTRKIILYTDDLLSLDATVYFEGEPGVISSSSGFFRYDYRQMYYLKGIRQSLRPEKIHILNEGKSLRALLQRKIEKIEDEQSRLLCRRILLGIYDKSGLLSSSLAESGFSIGGLLYLIQHVMNHYTKRRHMWIVYPLFIIGFGVLYHFPFPITQVLVNYLIKDTDLAQSERIGVVGTIILILYPHAAVSAAFLIPLIIRISSMGSNPSFYTRFVYLSMYQSFAFGEINLLQMLLFSWFRSISGILILFSFFRIYFSSFPLLKFVAAFDLLVSYSDKISCQGSMVGFGLPSFLFLCFLLRKQKKYLIKVGILFYFFLYTGAFHPFAEIAFLNVGQGDAIFIKGPYLTESYMIDTGKPNQFQHVNGFLQAIGIRKLDALFITHTDDDHCGNMERIQSLYQPNYTILDHFDRYEGKMIRFIDLNDIVSNDENQSSLVLFTEIHFLKMLFMGDADSVTEAEIIKKYSGLRCDLLKCAHHGSKTGNSEKFLDHVQPSLAIISAGNYSLYHHPNEEVIQRLLKRRIDFLNTRDEGDIVIIFLPLFNLLITSAGKIGIIGI